MLTLWLVPRRAAPGGAPWDLIGSLQILVGLTALVYRHQGTGAAGDVRTCGWCMALVLGSGIHRGLPRASNAREHPLIDLTLFRLPDFPGAFAAACLGTAGAVGVELVLSQYLQLVEQRTALQAAMVFLPMAIAGFFAGPAGRAAACITCARRASPAAHSCWRQPACCAWRWCRRMPCTIR